MTVAGLRSADKNDISYWVPRKKVPNTA
jgi:hypothetical protein